MVNNSEEIVGIYSYMTGTVGLCVLMLDFGLDEIDKQNNQRGSSEKTLITLLF